MVKVFNTQKSPAVIAIRMGILLSLLISLIGFMAASATGETWAPLGAGMDADVYTLAVGSSGNIIAGGGFTSIGMTAANYIAEWNGSTWMPLGGGMNAEVYALAADKDGSLYAGGHFTEAGGVTANRVAKWDGTAWTALGSGMDADVYALAISTNGDLFAGGTFSSAGGVSVSRLARWDGSAWSDVGGGANGRVNTLLFDNLENLLVGGSFTSPASRIAKWDGAAWSPLGSGVSNTVRALLLDGSGNLYAGGAFASASGGSASRIARWDGTAWSPLGSGMNADVYALALSSSEVLYAGGAFTIAGGETINQVASWDGSTWSPLGSGTNDEVRALVIDGSESLIAGGVFTSAGGVQASHIARWAAGQPGPTPSPTPTDLRSNSIVPVTGRPLFSSGETTTVIINLTDVANLFGYQFIVNYDPALVDASGSFLDTFFDTRTNTVIPVDWNASCSSGVCRFAVSRLEPGEPITGSGPVAQIQFTGRSPGEFDLTISDDILTDRDSQIINHAVYPLHLSVGNYANVSGVVSLQGRSVSVDAGQVILTDLTGVHGPYTTTFDPVTGAFTFNDVEVSPGGTSYQLDAMHGLYLGNRTSHLLNALESFAAPPTRLLGGDSNNDGLIDLSDLTCIGGSFGGTPVSCGTTGSSDINADGTVNILDLVLPGGNYGLMTPGTW
jgi:hypothetical protein